MTIMTENAVYAINNRIVTISHHIERKKMFLILIIQICEILSDPHILCYQVVWHTFVLWANFLKETSVFSTQAAPLSPVFIGFDTHWGTLRCYFQVC